MTELLVVDLLGSGWELSRADVLTVAEIIAGQLADEHRRGRPHGDIGPHTVLLELADPPHVRVQDARLLSPTPIQRPLTWPPAPEGAPGLAADVFALGQVLRSLDAHARASSDDVGLPPFIQRMIDPDPARRPTVGELLIACDEGRLRPPGGAPAPTEGTGPAPKSTWPPAVAAATIFVLVLAGGLWWSNRADDAAVRDTDPTQAAVIEDVGPDGDQETTEPTTSPEPTRPPDPTRPPGPTRAPAPRTGSRQVGRVPEPPWGRTSRALRVRTPARPRAAQPRAAASSARHGVGPTETSWPALRRSTTRPRSVVTVTT